MPIYAPTLRIRLTKEFEKEHGRTPTKQEQQKIEREAEDVSQSIQGYIGSWVYYTGLR